MKIGVIDATQDFTRAEFGGIAKSWLSWEIAQHGGSEVAPSDADVVCVTAISPHEPSQITRALRRHKVDRSRQRVLLGGQVGMSPKSHETLVDAICVGEGRGTIRTLCRDGWDAVMSLPSTWVAGETREVVPDTDFPWDAPPVRAEDGVVRIYASRGCKKKCLFCQVGWQQPYTEQSAEVLEAQYAQLARDGHRVRVITNDAPALSFFGSLREPHFSASYSQMLEMGDDVEGAARAAVAAGIRSVRLGVEAPSSRLRRWIGKPIETGSLYDLSVRMLNLGIGVRWFLIAGLPGERPGDWDELRDVVLGARHDVKKGVLQLSFTAFCPDPAAPLCVAPIDDDYWDRYEMTRDWFFRRRYTRRIAWLNCQQPRSRMLGACASMGCTEDDVRRGWLDRDPPNWRIRYPLRHQMRRAWDVYARRCGLPASAPYGDDGLITARTDDTR